MNGEVGASIDKADLDHLHALLKAATLKKEAISSSKA